jgi:hypothetical protein
MTASRPLGNAIDGNQSAIHISKNAYGVGLRDYSGQTYRNVLGDACGNIL